MNNPKLILRALSFVWAAHVGFLPCIAPVFAQNSGQTFEQRPIRAVDHSSTDFPAAQTNAADRDITTNKSHYSLTRMVIGLTVVIGLIFLVLYFFRRFVPQSKVFLKGRSIHIVARTPLSARQSLCLVRFGKHLLLLGLTPNQISILDRVDDPEEITLIESEIASWQKDSISGAFSSLFKQESQSYQSPGNPDALGDLDADQDFEQAGHEVRELIDKIKGLKERSALVSRVTDKSS